MQLKDGSRGETPDAATWTLLVMAATRSEQALPDTGIPYDQLVRDGERPGGGVGE